LIDLGQKRYEEDQLNLYPKEGTFQLVVANLQ